METMCDIAGLEELPEVAATGLRRFGRNDNNQGFGNFNCQGQGGPTCSFTCGFTVVNIR
ncbi:MAG: hypothetical protein ACRDSR_08255 [Pseudonocardiaceae bacterium]